MKTISLWQPWATLIAIGAKRIETRSWDARYTGPIAIHAAKKVVGETFRHQVFFEALDAAGYWNARQLPVGAIVAVCNLDRVARIVGGSGCGLLGSGETIESPEYHFGDYAPGRFAWMLSGTQKLQWPIPYRGQQGWFNFPDEILARDASTPVPAHQTINPIKEDQCWFYPDSATKKS